MVPFVCDLSDCDLKASKSPHKTPLFRLQLGCFPKSRRSIWVLVPRWHQMVKTLLVLHGQFFFIDRILYEAPLLY